MTVTEEDITGVDLVAEADAGANEADDVDIDLSEAISFDPFDADDVPVRVVKATLIPKSKSSGKPYVKLQFEVEAGHEHAAATIFHNVNLTGKGAGFAFDDLEVLGALDKHGDPVSRSNPSLKVSSLPGLVALANVRANYQPNELDADGRGPDGYKPKAEIKRLKRFVSADDKEAANLK